MDGHAGLGFAKWRARAMIATMLDLAEIDRQLEQLGKPPDDLAALVERVLGPDRSPERIEALLATLGVGATMASEPTYVEPAPAPARRPSSHPPRALGRHARWTPRSSTMSMNALRPGASVRDTLVGQPSAAPPAPSGQRPAEPQASALARDTSRDTSPDTWADRAAQQAEIVEPFPLAVSQRAEVAESDAPEPDYDENDDVTEPAVVAHFTSSGSPVGWGAPMPSAAPRSSESAAEAEAERRVHMEALLDQDLEPRDFPSTPPKPNRASTAMPATEEDEFELLVEEEEILELDDVDLVEDDE
jgi:hypothetical protein